MKKAISSKKSGFTLIETLLYLTIISIILTTVVFFAWNVIYGGVKSSRLGEVNYSARYASERIQYEIRNSSGFTAGSSNFGVNLATTPGSKITLTNTDSAKNPTVIDVSSGQLRLTIGTDPVINITPINVGITSLVFSNNSSGGSKNLSFALSLQSNVVSSGNINQNISLESAAEVRGN
jgi:type II secretory pathway pseudopilin PulG